ncbi:MAG: YkgJ family cysteine cluster protein [Candidatus Krumholzibacteriota bacterium]|nr:YkgJ family cysteine cluster protein [Candidatus Krumholzibacteriota bacterium]
MQGREKKKTTGRKKNPCDECIPAKCCMYLSIEIDEPEDKGDWDDLLWMIAHRDIEIYMDEDRWYMMARNPCRFYTPDRGCLIYPKRPRICRGHTHQDCEFENDYDFELHFHDYEELERYIRRNVE